MRGHVDVGTNVRAKERRERGGEFEQRRSPDAVQYVQVTLDFGDKSFP